MSFDPRRLTECPQVIGFDGRCDFFMVRQDMRTDLVVMSWDASAGQELTSIVEAMLTVFDMTGSVAYA